MSTTAPRLDATDEAAPTTSAADAARDAVHAGRAAALTAARQGRTQAEHALGEMLRALAAQRPPDTASLPAPIRQQRINDVAPLHCASTSGDTDMSDDTLPTPSATTAAAPTTSTAQPSAPSAIEAALQAAQAQVEQAIAASDKAVQAAMQAANAAVADNEQAAYASRQALQQADEAATAAVAAAQQQAEQAMAATVAATQTAAGSPSNGG